MGSSESGINGHAEALTTERVVEEMRRGRAVQLFDGERWFLVAAVETTEQPLLSRLRALPGAELALIVTPQRAQAAGLASDSSDPVAIGVSHEMDLASIRAAAGLAANAAMSAVPVNTAPAPSGAIAEAGFQLTKLGKLMPALLVVDTDEIDDPGLMSVRLNDLSGDVREPQIAVELISRARVPLADALECEIVLFRQRSGPGDHLAIVIGAPDMHSDVAVRLHSACLTGDVLGSLRCDCGDQLKRAITRIAALGGGVLLYLDQEGRGIGLANKLRAYALQDAGLDTIDADQHLGFLPDERDYAVAAAALRHLGIERIRLLTNNPAKIASLKQHGIEVTGRLPLVATVNAYNQRYLKAKLDKAGHLAE